MDFSKEKFAERFKKTRIERGILAKDIAATLGFSKSAVSQLEKGLVAPTIETFFKLCQLLDVSADYLLGLSTDQLRR